MPKDYIDIEHDFDAWQTLDGRSILESDYYAGGLKWRVHKNDADPFPSSPHAHCIAGQDRYVGCKLHLGTGVLYIKRDPWKKLYREDFMELIAKIRSKFPDIELPIPAEK